MSALTAERVWTANDLLQMPGDARFELIQGELIPMPPPPGGEHGYRTLTLAARIQVYVEDHDLGYCFAAETGFKIAENPDTVKGADFAFVAKNRLPEGVPAKHVPLAPDIVLETRSPGDSKSDVASKVKLWLQAGVRVVWTLDPGAKTLTIHRPDSAPQTLAAKDTLREEDILPGFSLSLARVLG